MTPDQLTALMPTIPEVYLFHGNAYTQYQPGQKAGVCVSLFGRTAINGQVQYFIKAIDKEDTYWNSNP